MAFEKNEDELGALWEKSGAKGAYMTGTIEIDGTKHNVVLFKNGNKKSEKSPDWRVLRSKPKADTSSVPF
jgi:hypothetical protein